MRYKIRTASSPSDWVIVVHDCAMARGRAVCGAKTIEADGVLRAIEEGEFTAVRGPFRFRKYDHKDDDPVYFGKVVAAQEFGQPVLNIDEVAQVAQPTQNVVSANGMTTGAGWTT